MSPRLCAVPPRVHVSTATARQLPTVPLRSARSYETRVLYFLQRQVGATLGSDGGPPEETLRPDGVLAELLGGSGTFNGV